MNVAIILLIVAAAAMVLFSLVRGLIYFSQSREGAISADGTDLHLMQNKMMFARVKWQAIAIILLVVLGMVAAN